MGLRLLQQLSLNEKIKYSKLRIQEWYENWDGNVSIAFSGGKDSTVLLHLVRSIYPETQAYFCNTGLEFPEITNFVKTIDDVKWLRPKKSFNAVIKDHGYPVVSKTVALMVYEIRNTNSPILKKMRLEGVNRHGTYNRLDKLPEKWHFLIDAPFKISEKCCAVMKKRPFKKHLKEIGHVHFNGMMASESYMRQSHYTKYGCNAYDLREPKSQPLAIWTEQDIWDYIKKYNIAYSDIYKNGYHQTGCVFCMFGIYNDGVPNRFQKMYKTHKKLWEYCMYQLDLKKVLDFLKIPYI